MLTQRIATAIVAVPLIVLLIYLGGSAFVALVAVALAVASVEVQMMRRSWRHPLSILCGFAAAALAAGAYLGYEWLAIYTAATVAALGIGVVLLAGDDALAALGVEVEADRAFEALWTVGGVMYVGFLGAFFVLLREADEGRDWVYLALFATYAVDTAAYFTGRAIGRTPLAPRISPKKTVEGFAGGYAGGFAAVLALGYAFGLDASIAQLSLLGVLLPGAAAVGDLAESAIKRSQAVKDASELVPGHGGVLDRLDSLLFTFPLTYLFIEWVVR